MAFSNSPESLPELKWRNKKKRLLQHDPISQAKRQVSKALACNSSLILSGEIMIDRLNEAEFAQMVAALRDTFDRVVAIAYVRPLASLAASQFQQRIKTGQRRFVIPAPDYRKRFEKVRNLFGPEDIVWRRFDRKDLKNGDIVSDFAAVLGVDRPGRPVKMKNESLTAEVLAAVYAFNRFTAPLLPPAMQHRMRAELLTKLQGKGDTKFGFSPELIERHLERHEEDIDWMESICGFDVRGNVGKVATPIADQKQLLDLAGKIGDRAQTATISGSA
ncbi:hypothetical protein [Paracoccus siganidrum]|uniref:Uncharacterized protein n=1 Tax=Paracoccus siganidrum TaxID=1276757 RepID=A0A419A599_9RHOB|nr:hypothetical protein [Paracoccus siganidrum]RJL10291.1 hypothetical protein D3P05_14220 [Paracoccus siganidrum]